MRIGRHLKTLLLVMLLAALYFVCNLDFPYDPLDPSTRTHYTAFKQMAIASLIALGAVVILPIGLFLFVSLSRLLRGEWRIWRWFGEFWRVLWHSIRDDL